MNQSAKMEKQVVVEIKNGSCKIHFKKGEKLDFTLCLSVDTFYDILKEYTDKASTDGCVTFNLKSDDPINSEITGVDE